MVVVFANVVEAGASFFGLVVVLAGVVVEAVASFFWLVVVFAGVAVEAGTCFFGEMTPAQRKQVALEDSGWDSSITAQKVWTPWPQVLQGCPCRTSPVGNLQSNPRTQRGIGSKVGSRRSDYERRYDSRLVYEEDLSPLFLGLMKS